MSSFTLSNMDKNHIVLYRYCDHTYQTTTRCDLVSGDSTWTRRSNNFPCICCQNPPRDWCAVCDPIAIRVKAFLAEQGFNGPLLEKLTQLEVRRQNPGDLSGLLDIFLNRERGADCRVIMNDGADSF